MIGQTISHYKILEKLGEGGMGVVYKAEDTKLKRYVALKFLPSNISGSNEELIRFRQEAEAISALNHPGIATIYDIDEFDGKQFLAFEFIPGGTLKSMIRKLTAEGKKLPVTDVIELGIQMAEGLGHAHRHGIIHRDVKSDNVMLTGEGKVKITDFGLAKVHGAAELTKAGSTIGTLAYMAPEQLRGEGVDHRADLFSLGVIIYEMATSRMPFQGEHEAAIMYSIANEEPVPATSLREDIPSMLDGAIMKCLQKDPSQRYRTADELAADLRQLQQGATGSSVNLKKRPVRYWTGAVTALIIVLAGVYFYVSRISTGKQNTFDDRSPKSIAAGKSIAVLPFENLSDSKENEYFSDGITEDIIMQLSKISGLKVISRTSVMQYKGTNKNIREIGKELGVGAVLEGSVRRSGNQLRIVSQLIDASTDEHLWANTFDRELKDIFAVQDDITSHIVSSLTVTLTGAERGALSSSRTTNVKAHDLYLQGLFHFNQFTSESLNRALEYFHQAIREDSGYAEPYAGIAYTYEALADFYLPPREAYPRAKNAAQKALEIDSTNGEAHAALGTVLTEYDWNFAAGEQELHRAIQFSPNSVNVNIFYSQCAGIRGNVDEALAYVDHAITLDPLSPVASWSKEWYLYWARKYDDVIAQHKRTATLDANFLYWDDIVGAAYREKGMLKESLEEYLKAQKLSPDRPLFGLAITYARLGKVYEARKILTDLEEASKKRYVTADQIAMIDANIGEKDEAFAYLEQAFQARSAGMAALKIYPEYDPIRSDPRFVALLQKIGLEK